MTPDRERLRALTLDLRQRLDRIDDAVAEAQDILGEIETAAGLVDEHGKRIDE